MGHGKNEKTFGRTKKLQRTTKKFGNERGEEQSVELNPFWSEKSDSENRLNRDLGELQNLTSERRSKPEAQRSDAGGNTQTTPLRKDHKERTSKPR